MIPASHASLRAKEGLISSRGCGFTTVCSRTCASHDEHIVGSAGSSWEAIGRVRFVVVTTTDRGNLPPPPAPPRPAPLCSPSCTDSGSNSLAGLIRWASALRRCSTGSASTPLTISAAWSSETVPAAMASRTGSWSRSSACASSRRRFASRFVCRVSLAHQDAVSAAPVSVPSSRTSAACRMPSSRAATRACSRCNAVRVSAISVCDIDQNPTPGDLVQVGLGGGDRGRHRVPGEVVEYRCHTGNSGIGHRQSRAWKGVFRAAVEKYFRKFSWCPRGGGFETALARLPNHRRRPPGKQPQPCAVPVSVAAAFDPMTTRSREEVSTPARWRSLLDHRGLARLPNHRRPPPGKQPQPRAVPVSVAAPFNPMTTHSREKVSRPARCSTTAAASLNSTPGTSAAGGCCRRRTPS